MNENQNYLKQVKPNYLNQIGQNYLIELENINKTYENLLINYIMSQGINENHNSENMSGEIPNFVTDNDSLDSLIQYHFMPRGDGNGPDGDGPRTGRGRGNCVPDGNS
jgi:hypothetical protein